MKRKRGGQPGNSNARKHGFYSPTLSPQELSLVWNVVNVKSIDPAVAVIRVKLASALQASPGNYRLLEDAAKVLTKRRSAGLELDQFDRRQLLALILTALEASHCPPPATPDPAPQLRALPKQNEAGCAQTLKQDEPRLSERKPRRRTDRACQARRPKQDESSVL